MDNGMYYVYTVAVNTLNAAITSDQLSILYECSCGWRFKGERPYAGGQPVTSCALCGAMVTYFFYPVGYENPVQGSVSAADLHQDRPAKGVIPLPNPPAQPHDVLQRKRWAAGDGSLYCINGRKGAGSLFAGAAAKCPDEDMGQAALGGSRQTG
jgi:hypothetical protein